MALINICSAFTFAWTDETDQTSTSGVCIEKGKCSVSLVSHLIKVTVAIFCPYFSVSGFVGFFYSPMVI